LAQHHWYIPLDNLTVLSGWLSDSLCKTVTGDGFTKRELYSDDDDIIYSFRRCIGLNGINLVAVKPDLLDRCLIFELDPIPQNKRKEEMYFWRKFNEFKPKMLGAMFTVLSKAMKIYPNIKLDTKPRMADFAQWGCAISRVLGRTEKEFLEAYSNNIKTQNKEALDASPVAVAIIYFMGDVEKWEGSASELLKELNTVAEKLKLNTKDKRYPKDPSWLWRRIKEVRTNLMAVGINAIKDDSNRHSTGRRISIETVHDDTVIQQDGKNAVRTDMVSGNEQYQEVTPDSTPDSTDSKNLGEDNAVSHNTSNSLDSDSTDTTDSILGDFKGETEQVGTDPWD